MQCGNCGAEALKESKFCNKCGIELIEFKVVIPRRVKFTSEKPNYPQWRRTTGTFIGLIALILFVLLVSHWISH